MTGHYGGRAMTALRRQSNEWALRRQSNDWALRR
jgi:hypothetical protein